MSFQVHGGEMQSFDFQHRTRFVFAAGAIRRLGPLAVELGCRRAFIVSDPGVVRAGHFQKGSHSLTSAGLEIFSFHDLHENPTTEDVDRGLAIARTFQPDLLVGLGGGSSMDCAKGINFLYSCGGSMKDYWGVGKATKAMLPMIAVPTTAGTGSEAQSFALISDAQTKAKMACGDPKAACRIAILDPELTLTQPPRVTALTGIDALTHALETFVTRKRNPISTVYSAESWRQLSQGFPLVLDDPGNMNARGQVQWGACLAGLAIETSMLGVCHAVANPLTSRYGMTHGQAVGLMMPHVIHWNGEHHSRWYSLLWNMLQSGQPVIEVEKGISKADGQAVIDLADWMSVIVEKSGLALRLRDCGVHAKDFQLLAEDAVRQWTASFNPRDVTLEAAKGLYEAAW